MFNNLLESLYNKVLVNIVKKSASMDVYIEIYSKKSIIDHVFESFNSTALDSKMVNFIEGYLKESPYYYISVLDTSMDQGAIPTCNKSKSTYYKDLSASEYKCYDKEWTYYTSKSDLYEIEKQFHEIGVDFIFSPFVLLSHFFQDKISAKMAMYILIEEASMSLAVFESGKLLYAEHLDMEQVVDSEDDLLSQGMSDEEEIDIDSDLNIDLEDVDVIDDIEGLEDFGDIEDLDSLEDIDEFAEDKDLEEELLEVEEPQEENNDTNFNEDYQRFSLINSSLGHYYSDTKYESQFIETVYIADSIGVSSDLKRYLEEEMFLNVYIRRVNISMELCEITKRELGL